MHRRIRCLPIAVPAAVLSLILAGGCLKKPLQLEPKDARPVYRVQVEDGDEASLLAQQLKVEPVRLDGPYLYLIGTDPVLSALVQNGYRPERVDPYAANYRVVEVRRKGSEAQLLATGVTFINREADYWVVRGSLTQLKNLELAGYALRNITREPRPRELQIRIKSREQIQAVAELPVDIYSVRQEREGYVVYGAAFDAQIDELKREGYVVIIESTVLPPAKPGR